MQPGTKVQNAKLAQSEGAIWRQLTLGEVYLLDIAPQYCYPYGNMEWLVSDQTIVTVERSVNKNRPGAVLVITGKQPGKCYLTLIPVRVASDNSRHEMSERSQTFNIEITDQPAHLQTLKKRHSNARAESRITVA